MKKQLILILVFLSLLLIPCVLANDVVTVHVGLSDCKFWLANVLNIPHAFVLLNSNVYEVLKRQDNGIRIGVSDFEDFLKKKNEVRFVYSFKISRAVFYKKVVYLKFILERSEYNLFWNNCYHFVYQIWKERERG